MTKKRYTISKINNVRTCSIQSWHKPTFIEVAMKRMTTDLTLDLIFGILFDILLSDQLVI